VRFRANDQTNIILSSASTLFLFYSIFSTLTQTFRSFLTSLFGNTAIDHGTFMSEQHPNVNAMYVGGDADWSISKQVYHAIILALVTKPKTRAEFESEVSRALVDKTGEVKTAYARFVTRLGALKERRTWEKLEDVFEELPHTNDKLTIPYTDLPKALCATLIRIEGDLNASLLGQPSEEKEDIGDRVFAYAFSRSIPEEGHENVISTATGSASHYLLKQLHTFLENFP